MTVDGFEWDSEKAESHLAKHGVSFEIAIDALQDVRSIEEPDMLDAERVAVLGMSRQGVLFVIVVERGKRTRIISARKANRHQIKTYTEG